MVHVAAFTWTGWKASRGLSGNFPMDWVADIRGICTLTTSMTSTQPWATCLLDRLNEPPTTATVLRSTPLESRGALQICRHPSQKVSRVSVTVRQQFADS
jgi:hypothetical protein